MIQCSQEYWPKMRLCVILVLLIWTSCSEGICDQAVIMVNGVVLRRLTNFFFQFCTKNRPNFLNVHVVPHSHDGMSRVE